MVYDYQFHSDSGQMTNLEYTVQFEKMEYIGPSSILSNIPGWSGVLISCNIFRELECIFALSPSWNFCDYVEL